MFKSLFLSHFLLLNHGNSSHPENSVRLQMIFEDFKKSLYSELLDLSCVREATKEELVLVHEEKYVDDILALDGKESLIDSETLISKGSIKAARLAAGLGIELTEQVIKGKIQNGFAIVRPPGHHATPKGGMGFCVFNNIAIAAKKARFLGLKRVMILDWDVHHGNGTQETFYEDESVLLIDLHQDHLFPVHSGLLHERGSGKGTGYTVNIPLPPSCHDEDYIYIFDELITPIAKWFNPELILVSAGFDAHESDPMGFMNLTTKGFGLLTEKIKLLALELCEGKLILFLEGGYNPYFLAKNVLECVEVLIKEDLKDLKRKVYPSKEVERLVKEIYETFVKLF